MTFAILAVAATAAAQLETTHFDTTPLRDGNRFVLGGGIVDYATSLPEAEEKGIAFEVQASGDLPLWGLDKVRRLASNETRLADRTRHWATQGYATVTTRIRMLSADSAPVPPPSFMPRFTIQRIGFRQKSAKAADMLILNFVPFAHHSNGQTGCPLEVQEGDDCKPQVSANHAIYAINTEDGNFSTHYVEIGACHRSIGLRADDGQITTEVTYGGALEQHIYGFDGAKGTLSDELAGRYGTTRLRAMAGVVWHFRDILDRLEMRFSGQRIVGQDIKPKRVGQFEALLHFGCWKDMGLFYRVYSGPDYYNVNFETHMLRAEFGAAFNWGGSDKRGLPSPF
ncbi:MAG: hypothetical protein OXH63_23790 [Gemmatimonadetes bacterium]|nr:hypothetical protein [Gemmatimonadota bacterium]